MMTRDVGDAFMYIIQLLAQGVSFCFSLLNSITFLGTSLLNYFVAIAILSALFPVIFLLFVLVPVLPERGDVVVQIQMIKVYL